MPELTVSNRYIDSLVDYTLDVKPYHTKLSEVVEEYQFEDSFSATVTERVDTLVVMGPDYLKNSSNPQRRVWENAPIRSDSVLNAERVFQSDGIRKTYSVPAIVYHKAGDLTGNQFSTVVGAVDSNDPDAVIPCDIPGLDIGVFNQQKFYGTVKSVLVDSIEQTLNTDYFVSQGAFSFVTTTNQTWKQHNLLDMPEYEEQSGLYEFEALVRNYGMIEINDIFVSQDVEDYEEWTLTWDTSISAFHVVGSASGHIGTAAVGPFEHEKIGFTVKEAPGEDPGLYEIPDGETVKLTPKNKITIHHDAPEEIWTLINVGDRYLVYGSESGWQGVAMVDEWYDNGKIGFKIPALSAFVFVNGVPYEQAIEVVDGNLSIGAGVISNSALPSMYEIVFREPAPDDEDEIIDTATVFNSLTGYKSGLMMGTAWSDEWINMSIYGTLNAGDVITVFLAPGKIQATQVGYDEFMYEFARYGAGYAESFVADGPLEDYLPLYHSQDAVIIPDVTIGQTVEIDKVQREFLRMRLGTGEALHDSLGANNGWVPLDYRPSEAFPDLVETLDVYMAADPYRKIFTVTQPVAGNGKPGLATLTFDDTFFSNYIDYLTTITFQFHQADDYGQQVGVNFSEAFSIQTVELGPSPLFADDEPGGWWDPSDFATMYQDSVGLTPVTNVEQTVGLMLDKRYGLTGDSVDVESVATSGLVSNNGDGSYTLTGAASVRFNVELAQLVSGDFYEVNFTISGLTGSCVVDWCNGTSATVTSNGTHKHISTRSSYDSSFRFFDITTSAGQTATIRINYIRQIRGNHRVQETANARPILRARYNLLQKTDLMEASWTAGLMTLSTETEETPIGTSTARKLTPTTSNGAHTLVQSVNLGPGQFVFSVYAKAAGYPRIGLRVYDGTVYRIRATVDLTDGSIINAGSPAGTTTVTDVGNGWYHVSVLSTVSTGGMGSTTGWCIESLPGTATVQTSYVGDGVSGTLICGADARYAEDAAMDIPIYQSVNTATDYDSVGFPVYLAFDGSNDYMRTRSVNFSGTDKMTLFTVLTRTRDSSQTTAIGLSDIGSSGGVELFAPPTAGSATYGIYSNGGTDTNGVDASGSPRTCVIACQVDHSGVGMWTIRINGVETTTVGTSSTGTGNLANAQLHFGRSSGTGTAFSGREYQTIIRGAGTDLDLIERIEKLCATRVGITLP